MKKFKRAYFTSFIIISLLLCGLISRVNNVRADDNVFNYDIGDYQWAPGFGWGGWSTRGSSPNDAWGSSTFSSFDFSPGNKFGGFFTNILSELVCPYVPGVTLGPWVTCPPTPSPPPWPSPGEENEVFSKEYEISKGKYGYGWDYCWGGNCGTTVDSSMSATDTFSVPEKGIYYVRIYNGGEASYKGDRVSSGEIKINNKKVIKSNDFNKNETFIEVQLELKKGINTLYVKINGAPGAFIVVKIVKIVEPVPPPVIEFEDAKLEAAVRAALGIGKNEPLTEDLLLGLTDLYVDSLGIKKLGGIEYCTNLEFLSASDNKISDVGPLAFLHNLIWLHLARNNISNVSALEYLTELEWLNVSNNTITSLFPLIDCDNLEWLNLSNNPINPYDLSDLSHIDHLYFTNDPAVYDRTTGMMATDSRDDNFTFTFEDLLAHPADSATLTLTIEGDVDESREYLSVYSGNRDLGDIFKSGNLKECDGFNEAQIEITPDDLESLMHKGKITFTLIPSNYVDFSECHLRAYLRLEYERQAVVKQYVFGDETGTATSDGDPLSFTYKDIPLDPLHNVNLIVNVNGDVGNPSEYITVKAGTTKLGDVYKTGGLLDCSGFYEEVIQITKEQVQSLTTDGKITFTLVPSSAVGYSACNLSAYLKLEYVSYVFGQETDTILSDGGLSFTYRDIPEDPVRGCILELNVEGDLDSSNEYITVKAGSTIIGQVYKDGDPKECNGFNEEQLEISASKLQSLTSGGEITFTLVPSSAVGFGTCDLSVYARLAYESEPPVTPFLFGKQTPTVNSDEGGVSFTYSGIPVDPLHAVNLIVKAKGDLGGTNEYITVKAGTIVLGNLYNTQGQTDCGELKEEQITISKDELKSLTTYGKITFTLVPSSAVSYGSCDLSVNVKLDYVSYAFGEASATVSSDGALFFTFREIPANPQHPVKVVVKAKGDLGATNEYLTIKAGSTELGNLYTTSDQTDCGDFKEVSITLSKDKVKSLAIDNKITFTLVPSSAVGYGSCDLSANLTLVYESEPPVPTYIIGETTATVNSDGDVISFTYEEIPSNPLRNLTIIVKAKGDLGDTNEYITLKAGATILADLYRAPDLVDCGEFEEEKIIISKSMVQSLTVNGQITFSLVPSGAVSYGTCDLSANLTLVYVGEPSIVPGVFGKKTATATSDQELSFAYNDVPANPLENCILSVFFKGDVDHSSEFITVKAGSTVLGYLYKTGNPTSCDVFNEGQIFISKSALKNMTTNGEITFTLIPSAEVNICDSSAYIKLAYESQPPDTTSVFGKKTATVTSDGVISFTYREVPAHPLDNCILSVYFKGDIDQPSEYITVTAGGTELEDLYATGNPTSCDVFNEGQIFISKSALKNMTTDGEITFTLIPSEEVNYCDSSAYIKLTYENYLPPDSCVFGQKTPIMIFENELSFIYKGIPSSPHDDVILILNADGDLGSTNEFITVKAGDTVLGDIYRTAGLTDCSGLKEDIITIGKDELASLTTNGEITFTLIPSGAVSYVSCDLRISAELTYVSYIFGEQTPTETSEGSISFNYRGIPSDLLDDVILIVNADGDLGKSYEFITVKVGSIELGDLYNTETLTDCSGFHEGFINITKDELKSLATEDGKITFTLVPSIAVDFSSCPLRANVILDYQS